MCSSDLAERARRFAIEAEAAGRESLAAIAHLLAISARLRLGELEWDRERAHARELAHRSGDLAFAAGIELLEVSRTIAATPTDATDAALQRMIAAADAEAMQMVLAGAAVHLYGVCREQGRLGEIEPLLVASAALGQPLSNPIFVAHCRLEADDLDGAAAMLTTTGAGLERLHRTWTHDAVLMLAADLSLELGNPTWSEAIEERLLPAAGQVVTLLSLGVLGRADRGLGRLAEVRGDLDLAIERYGRARELDEIGRAHV